MRTRQTSIETYHEIVDNNLLSTRRMQVYKVLFHNGPLTGAQIAILVKKEYGAWAQSETIRNRLTEMRDNGTVTELGTTICPTNGRKVILWDVTPHLPKNFKKPKKTKCKHCNGKGFITDKQLKLF